jgi:hypothetical protein
LVAVSRFAPLSSRSQGGRGLWRARPACRNPAREHVVRRSFAPTKHGAGHLIPLFAFDPAAPPDASEHQSIERADRPRAALDQPQSGSTAGPGHRLGSTRTAVPARQASRQLRASVVLSILAPTQIVHACSCTCAMN